VLIVMAAWAVSGADAAALPPSARPASHGQTFIAGVAGENGGGESQPCLDPACTRDGGPIIPAKGSFPVVNGTLDAQSVTVTASTDTEFPGCSEAKGPWQASWVAQPTNPADHRDVKLADFGPLSSGTAATRILPPLANEQTYNQVLFWTGTQSQCAQFQLVGDDVACGSLKVNASVLRYETDRTVVGYNIVGIGRRCGPVALIVADRRVRTFPATRPSQSGEITVKGRFCDPSIQARQRGARASASPGLPQEGTLLYAHDLSGYDGEALKTGDKLCQRENLDGTPLVIAHALAGLRLRPGRDGVAVVHLSGFDGTALAVDDAPAHIRIEGSIEAKHLRLAIGGGHYAAIALPRVGPAQTNVYNGLDPRTGAVALIPLKVRNPIRLTNYTLMDGTGGVFDGTVTFAPALLPVGPGEVPYTVLVSPGSVTFRHGLKGTGSVIAEVRGSSPSAAGDITIDGPTDFVTPSFTVPGGDDMPGFDETFSLSSPATITLG
jgi:hypothetical protein